MTQSKMHNPHLFSCKFIQHAAWLQHRFNLSRHTVPAKAIGILERAGLRLGKGASYLAAGNSVFFRL